MVTKYIAKKEGPIERDRGSAEGISMRRRREIIKRKQNRKNRRSHRQYLWGSETTRVKYCWQR